MHIRIQDTWTKSKWLLTELLMLIMTFCCAWGCTKWCTSRSHQCPNQIPKLSQLDSFSAKEQQVLPQVSIRMSRLVTLFLRLSFYQWSHSLGHCPRPYEGRNVDEVVNRELRLRAQVPFHHLHNCWRHTYQLALLHHTRPPIQDLDVPKLFCFGQRVIPNSVHNFLKKYHGLSF